MIVYKVTNKINGMSYIGVTKNSLEHRWKQHIRDSRCKSSEVKHKFQFAISEFGAENFTLEQIDVAADQAEAERKEMYWIQHFDTMENGYNTTPGGKNGGHRRKVVNVETGQTYDSAKEASVSVGRSYAALRESLTKEHLKCAGYHWKFVK